MREWAVTAINIAALLLIGCATAVVLALWFMARLAMRTAPPNRQREPGSNDLAAI
jgi:hypothetical protein